MLTTVLALICRIFSNPIANVFEKKLSEKHSVILTNTYCYFILSLFCIPFTIHMNWVNLGVNFWLYVLFAGILCTLGSVCLIKALQIGEMSVLGPINSYKCIIGLIFGFVFLGEVPNLSGIFGMLLIIFGSRFIFDTVKNGAKFNIFKRKDILLRFCALFFSGCEAVVLKKIIIMSSVGQSFVLWCFTGLLFSLVLMIVFKKKFTTFEIKDYGKCLVVAIGLGVMQLATNFVFERMNVGLSLALFQLSTIISVVFGYKIFHEKEFLKKIIGSVIMILGSCLILI